MIEAPDALFSGLAKDAKTRFGFTIDPHHFAMLGRCADCSSL
jgi:Fe2+ or Zn2+ uptake regulation protein